MNLCPLLSIFLLAQQSDLLDQEAENLIKNGESALNNSLWEVAELHFRNALADHTLIPAVKSEVTILLAEALVHEGSASEALDLLGQSHVTPSTEVSFWRAMALVSQRRFNEAISIFSAILFDPSFQQRIDAGFTLASLQMSFDRTDEALETLASLVPESDPETEASIRLYQVEVFLDLDRIEDARQAMPEKTAVVPMERPLADFLESRLQLKEGRAELAEAGFRAVINQSLTGQSHGLSLLHLHMATVGLADSLEARGDSATAAKSLLGFIQDHQNSPLLEAIFSRILKWLPEKPTATDPILERIGQWITAPVMRPIFGIPGATGDSAISAWPQSPDAAGSNDLLAFSLYTRAVGLHRIPTPEAQAEAKRLLYRLRIEFPGHFLTNRSLYQMARWHLDEGSDELALSILETLRELAKSVPLRGQAAFLEGLASYRNDDLKSAIRLFDESAGFLSGDDHRTARLHEVIAMIRNGDASGTTLIQLEGNPPDNELAADIELEKALSTGPPDARRTALDTFLTGHSDHPRAGEARLAAAEATLATETPDLSFASAQLDALAATPQNASPLPQARIALARLRIADLSGDSPATIGAAQFIIDNFPAQPEAAEAKFMLGRNLFQAGNYNSARLTLEDLAAKETGSPRAQAAWLLAARSAALGGTEASKKEALILFDNAIKSGGPITEIASLEKARHLIDMVRLDEARRFLEDWIGKLPADDSLQLPAGLLLGEALSSEGGTRPEALSEALSVYDKLLSHAQSHPELLSRLQYLRGQTLEQMPDKKDPSKKREKEAFQAYHSVLETSTPPAEWEYFELCGFHALELLEKAGRWQAAINVARKIASFKGPRADEAAARASEIQLKERIWED